MMLKQLVLTCFAIVLLTPTLSFGSEEVVSIHDTVQKAVKQHPQIKAILHNREAISNNLAAAIGRFLPSLDLASDFGLQKYNSQTTRTAGNEDRTRTASDSTVTITQNVFDGMDRLNNYRGSQARLTSAEYRLIDTVEAVALDSIRAHLDVARERTLLQLAEENVVTHEEVLDSIVERVSGGAGSKADEMQARGRVARAKSTLITYTQSLHTAEAEYIRQTGEAPKELITPEEQLEAAPKSLNAAIELTMDGNPKIKAADADIVALEKDKKVQQASFYPTVDIELSSRNTNNLDGSNTYLRDDRAMLAMSWNIFNGGSDYKTAQAADQRVKEAESLRQDTIEDLVRQTATAWAEYEAAVGQIEMHAEALQYSIQSRDMYMMQFNVGQRSLLDVLDSINEVFSNSVLLETANSNHVFSLYKFLALEGELIKRLQISEKAYDTMPN
ncbi:TolC family outer membrane protein [Pseudodesulfovibrio sp. zrk46]|uniref:TolC family outer membrane protein n=1 Tax=Pseudodesulfovibrio sp. zrk46 TaxID=2725288 RepID=UPI001FFCF4D2|nr:TolC family outer membrane protein [Pseudodesulfovibrio sp. zrk46]